MKQYIIKAEGQRACKEEFNTLEDAEEFAARLAHQQKCEVTIYESYQRFKILIEKEYIYS